MPDYSDDVSTRQKLRTLRRTLSYDPKFTISLIFVGALVAILEGIGLGFIYPVIQVAEASDPNEASGRVMEIFISVYEFFGVPFELGYLLIGLAIVMTTRYTLSFLISWLGDILGKRYERDLRTQAFEYALDAKIGYYDDKGTDSILNAVITETRYSQKTIRRFVVSSKTLLLILMYGAVMTYIAPWMTLAVIILLGGITALIRYIVEPAVSLGSRVAEANEQVQQTVQAGTQGIRDVKLFGLREEIYSEFSNWIKQYTQSEIRLSRNNSAIQNFYELSVALSIFILIYISFTFTNLTLGEIGIFLIAMFQLGPRLSRFNTTVYKLESYVSHLSRTHDFFDSLEKQEETSGHKAVSKVSQISFYDVGFSYTEDEQVLSDISFTVEKPEFIAFVGESGAGKSTIVSLLARMYDQDSGDIKADGTAIEEYDLDEWRERLAFVRQDPYIFNDTLKKNITIGNRDATRRDVKRVCKIAMIDEFLDELPNGYDSELGDEGVRLSGGQQQRVALARALLKDADFLILDEATSNLDSNLEKEVQAAIESMDRDYGIIAIAHRLSTVKNADRIYTVEDGEIVESGTHQELLEDDGEYAELYTIQSKG